ncbi:MAG: ABC transporter permease [Clostridiales bacterium]|nr:ABC transporter permease [Clostridiales bacterium]MBQ8352646.1 ABC transporter permease [Clostridia bacterium]
MWKYALKRIGLMLVTFFIIMAICFTLIRLLPLPDASKYGVNAALIQARREKMGYNKPIPVQFFLYWKNVFLYGDWGIGEEYKTGLEVGQVFVERLPATMIVNLLSILVSIPLGIGLGVFAALKKNRFQDYLISTLVMVAISVPSFVVAFLLQSLFYYRLGILPPLMAPTDRWLSGEMLLSLVMPVTALSLGTLAGFTRITRAELTETLTGDYMLLARAKGLTKLQATVRHAFKNSAVVVLPAVLGSFVGILSGSMIIERIFSIPGVGELYLGAILSQDYNFFMMLSAFYTFVGLSAGLIVDLSYGLIDPRVRIGQR